LKRKDSPFADPPREKGVQWLQPKLVAEVAYAERTKEGILRQASFVGLREDLPSKSVGEEKPVSLNRMKITHPERKVWPSLGVTKLELVAYYEEIGAWFLPHVKDRPLTLVRCPDGAEAKCFYQRHLPGKKTYMHVGNLDEVLGAVQNGAVEFHTWGATLPDLKHPDRFTIDLDPGPGLAWKELVKAARLTRTLLGELGLASFLKTTGGKGLHVVAPIVPELGWDEVKEFTRFMAAMLTRAQPDLFIDRMAKARRDGKIFVDYLRNSETASAVAAYSTRARPGAYVSTPLSWDEIGAVDLREKFSIKTVRTRLKRLRSDPWRDYRKTRQRITKKMISSLG
jgi:bifunctional non-homologous end joining protein LigD